MNERFLPLSALAAILMSSACGGAASPPPPPSPDGAVRDASADPDAALDLDGGVPDGEVAGDAGDVDAGPSECPLPPTCDAAPPDYGPTASWRHSIASPATTILGAQRHRGRDLVLRAGDPQWVIGKFAYGLTDKDLEDEDVDLYLLRGCGAAWEPLGTATTTQNGATPHATVEGIADDGGRVFFEIPAALQLAVGRHRIHMVVRGDHSHADMYIDVVDGPTAYVVTDVDGTLTSSETAEWAALLGSTVGSQPSSPEALHAAVARGYRVFYLTARPDWLTTRTHEWLAENGYPLGLVHTTNNGVGALGAAAATFKTDELNELQARIGQPASFAIGNKTTDAEAFRDVGVDAAGRYFYQLAGDPLGGTIFNDYAELIPIFGAMPLACF